MLEGIGVSDQRYGGDYANRFPELDGHVVVNLAAGFGSSVAFNRRMDSGPRP